MKKGNLAVLAAVAVVLGGAAYMLSSGSKPSAAKLNGKTILPGLDVSAVASIEVGDKLKLSAGDDGWTLDSLYGYPADRSKIAENLLKLVELKVGQVARGRALGDSKDIVLKDAAGKELARLSIGDRHRGRYVGFAGETVLVSDSLDAFDGSVRDWCDTNIADFNVSFNDVADPALTPEETGIATGVVHTVTVKEGTNDVQRVAVIGGTVKDGSDRYFKPEGGKWTYVIPSYSADRMLKEHEKPEEKAEEKVEEKVEEKAEEKAEEPVEKAEAPVEKAEETAEPVS